ncbi:MAG: hypothetical protein A2Y71_12015 [Bacteroidetes bacterium RBG_13_42_15]|nr:MAG: hypothetical protein A2Y71_12015 [Bacteroidetes bacterium RBG_13_42_15]
MKKKQPYNGLRWTARISGTLLVAFTLFFVIADFIDGMNRNNGAPLASFSTLIIIIFIIGGIALAGLILALWKEGMGGVISLGSFILIYILNLFNTEASVRGGALPIFFIFSVPSILYLRYWKLTRDIFRHKENTEAESSVRT